MRTKVEGCSPASGFSLIEVLVALVVLSVGLLGIVGTQAMALQNNREARLQSIAVDLARELAEMMRGNKDISTLGTANPYVGDFSGSSLAPSTQSSCLSIGSSCSDTTEVARAEMTEWLARVEANLPGARVKVCLDSAPYSSAGLPQWACTSNAANDVMVVKIGWSRLSTNAIAQDRAIRATEDSQPGVILPVTAGSTT